MTIARRREPGPPADSGAFSGSACAAPAHALYLFPDGIARSCCVNTVPLGNLAHDRLLDVWRGATRGAIAERIAVGDHGLGCESCGHEVATEGRPGSYPEQFDRFAPGAALGPAVDDDTSWPSTIGFYLSNACNLQCIQCNGESSSAIRLHRERRPALPAVYGDQFFEDLEQFIPHLRHSSFAGGEPFLSKEHHRVWDLIGRLSPGLPCTIVTNGTQFGARVEQVLAALRASIVVSIDSVHRERFESIRVGASFDEVVANLDRFADYARERGTEISINHCLMPQNYDEFPEVLLFAEDRGIRVDVSVVREPAVNSLTSMPRGELEAIYARLVARSGALSQQLVLNRGVLENELRRIEVWSSSEPDEREREGLVGNSPYTILMFRRDGAGPHDDARARADLVERAATSEVHSVTIRAGDLVEDCSPSFRSWLSLENDALVDRPVIEVHQALVDRFGPMRSWRETFRGDDRADAVGSFESTDVFVSMVAMRDGSGRADHARMLFAATPTGATAR